MDWKSSGPDIGGGGGGGGGGGTSGAGGGGGGGGGGTPVFCDERVGFLLFPLERFDNRVSSNGGGG